MTRPVAVLALAAALGGCGGGTEPESRTEAGSAPATTQPATTGPATEPEPPPTEAEAPPEPDPGLPAWTAGYAEWSRLNAAPIPPRDSDPHLSTKNVYASRPATGGVFPPGTIVVKEGVRPGTTFVGLIAAMRKLAGANPEHDDWVFVEWSRNAAGDPFTKLAEGAVCESCHAGAAGGDYVFTQD
jgi:hypothetical protein